MSKYQNLIILTIAIMWGGIKRDLFSNMWTNIAVSVPIMILLWSWLELTNNNGVKNE